MQRRTLVLAALLAGLIGATMFSVRPAAATRTQDLNPASIDPNLLRIPDAKLPSGAHIDYQGVSDNADADGRTIPQGKCPSNPGGQCKAQTWQAHQQLYELEGRFTGYRMDMSYTVDTSLVGTEYLGSIYQSTAKVKAAMDAETGPNSILVYVLGGQPLPLPCHAGDECKAYMGPNPSDSSKKAVFAVFRRGQILVETGSQVPKEQFTALEPDMEKTLYAMLDAADTQAQIALGMISPTGGTSGPGASPTPTTAATEVIPPAATAVPSKPPAKKCPSHATKKKSKCVCNKGYTMKKGKCVKKKRASG